MIFPDKEAGSYCVCYAFGQCVRGEDVQEGIVSYDVLPFFVKFFLCNFQGKFNPNRSLDFGEIARLCHAACFSPSRRRSEKQDADRGGQDARSLTFPIKNGLGVSNDRFGFKCAQGLQNARKMCNFATCAKTCKVWIFRKLGVKWKKSENTAGL